jgi:TPR repeat protein
MEGCHPYMARGPLVEDAPSTEMKIALGHFPHPHSGRPEGVEPPKHAPPFDLLHPDLQRLFVRAFAEGHKDPAARPTASQWYAALYQLQGRIIECGLKSSHKYLNHLSACPWCGLLKETGRDPYGPWQKKTQPARVRKPRVVRSAVAAAPAVPARPRPGAVAAASGAPKAPAAAPSWLKILAWAFVAASIWTGATMVRSRQPGPIARAQAKERDWQELSRLLKMAALTDKEKAARALSFLEAYRWRDVRFDELKPAFPEGSLRDYFEERRKSCQSRVAADCFIAARILDFGVGMKEDYGIAVELYRKACDLGDGYGCSSLGFMYGSGQGVGKDEAKAVELYRKACDLGDGRGCWSLGFMGERGQGVGQDAATAGALSRTAGDLGDENACMYVRNK